MEVKTFFEHAAAAGLPQEERDRIIRERNWTGEEQMTAADFEAVVTPAPEAAPEAGTAPSGPAPDDEADGLRAELDDAKRENEALRAELAKAKKPARPSRAAKNKERQPEPAAEAAE